MTTTPQDPGWTIQLAVHRAVRRDATRLAGAFSQGRVAFPAAISAYWAETATQLHHHHELEDTVLWPLMGERLGARVGSPLACNAQEHVVMAAAMDDFDAAVGAIITDAAAAREALRRLTEAVETHLAHEEAEVLPLIPEAFTADDLAFFKVESAKTNPASAFLPWVLDDAPASELAFFGGAIPVAVREQLESTWLPRRRAVVDALLGQPSVVTAGPAVG